MTLLKAGSRYIDHAALHPSCHLLLLLGPGSKFEMSLTLTHLAIDALIEDPKESSRKRILTSGDHYQILLADCITRDLCYGLGDICKGIGEGVGRFRSFDLEIDC